MQDRPALEVPAAADQRQPVVQGLGLALPELDRRVGPHDPLPVGGVQVDRHAAEGPAPLDHRRVVVRVRDGDGRQPARACGPPRPWRRRSARCSPTGRCRRGTAPARPAGRCRTWAVVPMPVRPGSSCRIRFVWSARSSSSVVHCWPPQPMYCRSSSQMAQRSGGASALGVLGAAGRADEVGHEALRSTRLKSRSGTRPSATSDLPHRIRAAGRSPPPWCSRRSRSAPGPHVPGPAARPPWWRRSRRGRRTGPGRPGGGRPPPRGGRRRRTRPSGCGAPRAAGRRAGPLRSRTGPARVAPSAPSPARGATRRRPGGDPAVIGPSASEARNSTAAAAPTIPSWFCVPGLQPLGGGVRGRSELGHVEGLEQVVLAVQDADVRPVELVGRAGEEVAVPSPGHRPAGAGRSGRHRRTTRAPTAWASRAASATSLIVPRALEAAPIATSRVRSPICRRRSSQSSCPVSGIIRATRTVTPRSRSSARQGSTLAWWSSSVTTISSPGPQRRPNARARWKVSVVMLAPKATSPGEAFRKSARACLASAMASSVSWLVGKAQWVLALW